MTNEDDLNNEKHLEEVELKAKIKDDANSNLFCPDVGDWNFEIEGEYFSVDF